MDCRQARARLGAFADGEMEQKARRRVQAHISDCSGCQEELSRLRALRLLLASLPPPPGPGDLESSILAAASRLPRHRSPGVWGGLLRAAAAALIALAGAYFGARSASLPRPPVEMAQGPSAGSVESLYEESFAPLPSDSLGARVLGLYQEEGR